MSNLRLDARTLRLAFTYLGIIMIMSVGFSLVLYGLSLNYLDVELQNDQQKRAVIMNDAPPQTDQKPDDNLAPQAIASINDKLQHKLDESRVQLRHELLLLNLGTLVLGSLLSYYLARQTLRPIEAALEAQSRFASDASHELRTPLAVMQTEIDVVLRSPHLTLGRATAALENNRREIDRLRDLSEGLLRLTHHDRPLTNAAPVRLDQITSAAIAQLRAPAKARHITITNTVPTLTLHGDAVSLTQLLVILLDNAIKYSQPHRTVHLAGHADKQFGYMTVRDQGSGIAPADLPHIFERFYRADTSRSRQITGYGLGLAIAQAIAIQHRGTITAQSTVEKGAVFTVKLPL